jgi:hypothetical protein
MRFFVALVLCAAVIAGCGEDDDEQPAAPPAMADLVVSYDADGKGGEEPEPVDVECAAAGDCDGIASVPLAAFEPTPGDVACTQQYGGPEVATVKGTFKGERVDATFSRQNGCEISRWEDAKPILDAGKS